MMRHVKTILVLMLMVILCVFIFIDESRRLFNPARILFINNSTNDSAVSFDWIPEVLLNGIKNGFSISNASSAPPASKGSDSYEVPLRGIGDSFMPFPETDPKEVEVTKGNVTLKKIVFWNDYFDDKSFGFGLGQEPFIKSKCRVNSCFTTADRSKFPLEEIDALIWHSRGRDLSLPSKRSPHTRYIFWLLESPMHVGVNLNNYKNLFNWTFNYRLDSDFYNPFDRAFRSREVQPVPVNKNRALGKTKFAAWFVSNCYTKSGRATLVKTLQKWIKVDIYGRCGTLRCSRAKGYDECSKLVQRDYKFYFAFENSLCKDYATEKIFNMLRYDVIPVVYGLFNYSALIPPGSYIDARSFPNAKSLADYLIYLDKNDTAYNEYFRWKPYHQISSPRVFSKPWCDLCARLHEDQTPKVYDLYKWYITDSNCKTDDMPEVSRFVQGLP